MCGLLVSGFLGAWTPWRSGGRAGEAFHRWLWDAPGGCRIDWAQLWLEWVVVAVAAGIALLVVGDRRLPAVPSRHRNIGLALCVLSGAGVVAALTEPKWTRWTHVVTHWWPPWIVAASLVAGTVGGYVWWAARQAGADTSPAPPPRCSVLRNLFQSDRWAYRWQLSVLGFVMLSGFLLPFVGEAVATRSTRILGYWYVRESRGRVWADWLGGLGLAIFVAGVGRLCGAKILLFAWTDLAALLAVAAAVAAARYGLADVREVADLLHQLGVRDLENPVQGVWVALLAGVTVYFIARLVRWK